MATATLEFEDQGDGTSNIDITVSTSGSPIADFFFDAVIHEFGDITENCINVGNAVTNEAAAFAGQDVSGVVDMSSSYTTTITGFTMPLKSIVGNSIVVSTSMTSSDPQTIWGCCVLGKAAAAVVVPD